MTELIYEPLADGLTRLWRLDEVLHAGSTAYQQVVIARTAQGITLFCDNERQSAEFSQLVYHEALVVPALLLAERLKRVLIVGSSEGVASQIAVRAGAELVDHVDIDREVVELCAKHLPFGYSPSEVDRAMVGDGPIRLHYADGWEFMCHTVESGERYDIVLVDLPDERDGEAQHNRLYSNQFLLMCQSALAPGGVVAYQAGCPTLWRNATLARALRRFHKAFDTTVYFGSDEHEWAFLFGLTETFASTDNTTEQMMRRLEQCRYHPRSIDADTLRDRTIPPYSLRRQ